MPKPAPGRLIPAVGLEDYFRQEIRSAFQNQKVQALPYTEFYLVRMLSDFCHRDNLFASPDTEDTPLAILYLESLQSSGSDSLKALRWIADFALYSSGFFQDSLHRQNIDLDYYVKLGGNAYQRLHSRSHESNHGEAFAETFLELSRHFLRFVDVLAEISENSGLLKDSDLLRLYEKWLSTGSERIKLKLAEFGIQAQRFQRNETRH
ncbi:MAG TPA: hypothetical protein DF383_01155 [Deltaproteobacteria bacterium]|nr:hypothetical protein [Deltaproteobacteria bacterium]